MAGVNLSPDGRSVAVLGPDGQWGIWPLNGGGFRPIPGLDTKNYVTGWTPDGGSVYVTSGHQNDRVAAVYRVDIATGKMELWKTFGVSTNVGITGVGGPRLSNDGKAYAYVYSESLSEAYVAKGLK
jgi:WD40 repeat protein